VQTSATYRVPAPAKEVVGERERDGKLGNRCNGVLRNDLENTADVTSKKGTGSHARHAYTTIMQCQPSVTENRFEHIINVPTERSPPVMRTVTDEKATVGKAYTVTCGLIGRLGFSLSCL
jgi:hypothetical protein